MLLKLCTEILEVNFFIKQLFFIGHKVKSILMLEAKKVFENALINFIASVKHLWEKKNHKMSFLFFCDMETEHALHISNSSPIVILSL